MTPRAVVFDLDGTLAISKSPVTPEMAAHLAQLSQETIVGVMSGGSWMQFQTQVVATFPNEMNLGNLYLFPVCAGYCFNYRNGVWQLLDDNTFTDEERTKIMSTLDAAMKATGFDKPPEKLWGERIEDRGALIAFSGLGQKAPVDEKLKWDPDRSKRKPLQDKLIELLPGYTIKSNAATTIDITRGGIDKAYGLRKLSEFTDIAINDMLYVGDALFPGGNDEVVKQTGIPTREVKDPVDTEKVIDELLA